MIPLGTNNALSSEFQNTARIENVGKELYPEGKELKTGYSRA
jgi:hypothetical protein